jgi:hypothetical protein
MSEQDVMKVKEATTRPRSLDAPFVEAMDTLLIAVMSYGSA